MPQTHPTPSTLNPQPSTLDPKPTTRKPNPRPATHDRDSRNAALRSKVASGEIAPKALVAAEPQVVEV